MILFVYFNRSASGGPIGLGVNVMLSLAVLKDMGYAATGTAASTSAQIDAHVKDCKPEHCIIEGLWVSVAETVALAEANPNTQFYVRCHSDLMFLQVEPQAVAMAREIILQGAMLRNLALAGNSRSFCDFVQNTYNKRCVYIPNLYDYSRVSPKRVVAPYAPGKVLRAASFGSLRLMKNHITGAAAGLLLARKMGVSLEFTVMTDGVTGGKAEVLKSIDNLYSGLPWARLTPIQWQSWSLFQQTVASQDIAFHLSCSETFNLTTADCLAEMVPVVGSEVITWLPRGWTANLDEPEAAADVGFRLLHDHTTAYKGYEALRHICETNKGVWRSIFA